MATGGFHLPNLFPMVAGEDLSAGDGLILKLNTSGQVVSADAGDGALVGLCYGNADIAAAGAVVTVAGVGCIYRCKVDGSGTAVNPADALKPDNSGRGVEAGAGDKVVGYAIGTSSAANEFVNCLVMPHELET